MAELPHPPDPEVLSKPVPPPNGHGTSLVFWHGVIGVTLILSVALVILFVQTDKATNVSILIGVCGFVLDRLVGSRAKTVEERRREEIERHTRHEFKNDLNAVNMTAATALRRIEEHERNAEGREAARMKMLEGTIVKVLEEKGPALFDRWAAARASGRQS